MIVELRDYIICNYPGVLHVAADIWPCRQFLVYTRQEPCETITSRSQLTRFIMPCLCVLWPCVARYRHPVTRI